LPIKGKNRVAFLPRMAMIKVRFAGQELFLTEIFDHEYGCYLWPSALFLSFYLYEQEVHGNILELGAGIGLPGLILAKCLGCNVTLTDKSSDVVLDNLKQNVTRNRVNAKVMSLNWGELIEMEQNIDYIIGSDIFYDPLWFEHAIVEIYHKLHANPNARCITSYQERSSKRMLDPLLDRYGLLAQQIYLDTFEFLNKIDESIQVWRDHSIGTDKIAGMESIFIIQIRLASSV
jgi:methyltransferase-like protein 23